MEKELASAEKEVLVEVVKLVQKMGLRGTYGKWKEFLNSQDKKFGDSVSDPTKKSRVLLVSFLESCRRKKCKLLLNLIRRCNNQRALEQFTKEFQNEESPQQRLVRLTLEHSLYTERYAFPSLDEEWMVVSPGNISVAMKSKDMIAIDCEMVGCKDGTDAVVRVCAVDQNLKVILDEKVNPEKEIVDYRTEITGIDAKDLEGVTCTLGDIKKSLKKLLSKGTILIGHSLHNDLQVLKIDHLRVIDTSYIFNCANLRAPHTPSLNGLCKVVLGDPVRKEGEAHDCCNDALAAMKLVLAKLKYGFDEPIIVPRKQVSELDLAKLLLHRIPLDTPTQELHKLFPPEYNIDIQTDIRIRNQFFSTYVVFKDVKESDAAFGLLDGEESKDLNGRSQKLVKLALSTGGTISFFIRKMAADDAPIDIELSNKRPAVEDGNQDSKRQRTCLYQCEHSKEIEDLKQKLLAREDEIFNLQKSLSAFIG